MDRLFFLLIVISVSISLSFPSCKVQRSQKIVAFYNLENLFDTINTFGIRDKEFTPEGKKSWNSMRYAQKLQNMSFVISSMGDLEGTGSPAVVGLCEMENLDVLQDLVDTKLLSKYNYQIVHEDSPDKRGIDVALIYRPEYFSIDTFQSVPLLIYNDEGRRIYSRNQLVVSGDLDGERFHFIVNHWPSRYGGKERSIPFRNEAARLSRFLVDSINAAEPNARIVLMGDLNDDPVDESVKHHLRAGVAPRPLDNDSLFNATASLFFDGQGTLCYRGVWNMFDQIIITPNLLKKENNTHHLTKTGVFDEAFLRQQEGDYKGYPHRTYVGNWYHGGYSDHFPSYIILKKKGWLF